MYLWIQFEIPFCFWKRKLNAIKLKKTRLWTTYRIITVDTTYLLVQWGGKSFPGATKYIYLFIYIYIFIYIFVFIWCGDPNQPDMYFWKIPSAWGGHWDHSPLKSILLGGSYFIYCRIKLCLHFSAPRSGISFYRNKFFLLFYFYNKGIVSRDWGFFT